jgi:hypothetical protein
LKWIELNWNDQIIFFESIDPMWPIGTFIPLIGTILPIGTIFDLINSIQFQLNGISHNCDPDLFSGVLPTIPYKLIENFTFVLPFYAVSHRVDSCSEQRSNDNQTEIMFNLRRSVEKTSLNIINILLRNHSNGIYLQTIQI